MARIKDDFRQDASDDAVLKLAAIVESSEDAIISKDLNGIITSWNVGAARLFGYSAEEIIGKSVTVLIPQDHLDEEPAILDRIRHGERIDHYETVRQTKDGTLRNISLSVSPLKNAEGIVVGASKIARDITDRKRAENTRELLQREIEHRVKNTMGLMQAIVAQTFKTASREEHRAFDARLQALARAHDLLIKQQWTRTSLASVVADALEVFRDKSRQRFTCNGPVAMLDSNRTLALTMVLHELGTNAVKYGALSNSIGRVDISWCYVDVEESLLCLTWHEINGPIVTPPQTKGFGSILIERALTNERQGASIDYRTGGIICRLHIGI